MSNFIHGISPGLAVEDVDFAVGVPIDTLDADGPETEGGRGIQLEVTTPIAVEVHSRFPVGEGEPLAETELRSVTDRSSGRSGIAIQGDVEADVIALR